MFAAFLTRVLLTLKLAQESPDYLAFTISQVLDKAAPVTAAPSVRSSL
jgi:hypothetical protein